MREELIMHPRIPFSRGALALSGLVLVLSLCTHDLARAQLNKGQQKCVNTANKNAQKVASALGKDICGCIKDGAKGKLTGTIEGCTTSDTKGKVDKAKNALLDKVAKDCTGGSGFLNLASAGTINELATTKELSLIRGIFGSDLDAAIITEDAEKTDSKCQQAVAKAAKKCQDTKWKEYNSCKKNKLKGKNTVRATSAQELQDECLGTGTGGIPDDKGKIAKKCDFSDMVNKKCPNKDVFPGCGTGNDTASLNDCIDALVECAVCLVLNAVDGLNRDCDLFDDGAADGSCQPEPRVLPGLDPNDIIQLASDAFEGRDNNTAGSVAAQEFLIDELEPIASGLDSSQTGRDAFKQVFSIGTNILALIPGGELAVEYVMVGAHYDHLGSACESLEPSDTICNGAVDNATGVAVVLAIGRALAGLPNPPRRSVILALWDTEEDGLAGSEYYVQNPLVPLASTIAYVNIDMQGANLLPSLRDFSVAVGPETGGAKLRALLDSAISGAGLGTRALSNIFGQDRSDHVNLINAGVPTVFFTDSNSGCWHTSEDEVAIVDFGKLEKQSQIALDLTLSLVDVITPPSFAVPASPVIFEDAVVLNDTVNAAIVDLGLFSPSQQTTLLQIQAELNAIVADGETNFDSADIATLLSGTIELISILTTLDCDGFLSP
jgi:hypothetical protein